jgi:hypothetical protein
VLFWLKEKVYNNMMHKGLYKERKPGIKPEIGKFLTFFLIGLTAFVVVFLAYKFLGNGAIFNQEAGLRPAASETEPGEIKKFTAKIEVQKFGGYAFKGQKDLTMMSFGLGIVRPATGTAVEGPEADNPVKIKSAVFSIGGYSDTADITSLQLYLDKKLIAQTPVVSGKAVFDNLALQFDGEIRLNFEVKANVGEGATTGNRVMISILKPDDILIEDCELNRYAVEGDFPVQSGYFTIVGNKIR